MNKFWGRNEHGSVPKFSRDDEQILALNYENLCDGDYLNRLFGLDQSNGSVEDNLPADAQSSGPGLQHDTTVMSADLPEDVIIYGQDHKLGRSLFRNRFHRQLSSSTRQSEAATNLVHRQSIVFEHIGKLMIERCIAAPPALKAPLSHSRADDAAGGALDCCLAMLEGINSRALNVANIQPLVALVFHVNQEATIHKKHPNIVSTGCMTITAQHIGALRNIFAQASLQCHAIVFSEQRRSDAEEAFRASMAAFYGLLALGLYTQDASEIMAAAAQLMMILMRAEEWYDCVKAESKAALSAALAAAAPTQQPANAPTVAAGEKATHNTTAAVPIASTKLGLKSKAAADVGKGKIANKVVNPVPAPSAAVSSTPAQKEMVTGPSVVASTGITVGNGLEEARTEIDGLETIVPVGQIGLHAAHNNSSSNMKTWEASNSNNNSNNNASTVTINNASTAAAKPNSKLPAEKDRGAEVVVNKKPTKNLKAEARAIQEILDPNTFTAQELSAYYANNPSTVGYVMKGNSNQGSEDVLAINTKTGVTKKSSSTTAPNNKNNNQPKSSEDGTAAENGAAPHRNGSAGGVNPSAAVARHKKAMTEFKDTLQSLLRIPKPVLKVLHDGCVTAAAASEVDKKLTGTGCMGIAGSVPGRPLLDATSGSGAVSTYVWSCGQNSYGELGLGDLLMRKSFTRVSCLDDKRIISVGAGNEHSLFVTQDGKLLTAGYNDNGQCGVGTTQQVRQPTVVAALEDEIAAVHVYNGCEHTLALTRDGKIYSFGYNYRGQLGLGSTTSENIPRPIRGLLSRRVVLAACSYHHSVMLCSDGTLYSCGRNDSGQLGHGDMVDKKTPQSVLNCPRGITSISCGQFHTVAATSTGAVYVCGKNDYGQVGLEGSTTVKVLTELPAHSELENVVQVCCGYYHTLLMSNTGVVAGFGRNDYGQLGLGHTQPKIFSCTTIASLRDKGVRMISAGCYHSVVITANGMLYVFGRNNHGQLATGDTEERHSPHPVDDFVGQRIVSVAAGFYHTIVLTASSGSDAGVKVSPSKLSSEWVDSLGCATPAVGGSVLHPSLTEARSTAATVLLMKDAAQLTGIKTTATSAAMVVPFSLDRQSRVSSRELLLFLTAHMDTLTACAAARDPKTLSVGTAVTTTLAPPNPVWITNVFCCIVAMIDICRGIVEDSNGAAVLPLSVEEALHFLGKVIRMCASLLRDYEFTLQDSIQKVMLVRKEVQIDSKEEDLFHLDYLTDLLSAGDSTKQQASPVTSLTSEALYGHFRACTMATAESVGCEEDVVPHVHACKALCLLRRKLLDVYFTFTPKEQQHNPKYQAISSDISLMFGDSHRVLLPSPAQVSLLFASLREYTMPPITTNGIRAFQQSLCVRVLAIVCAVYRNSEEVVHIFQESKLDSLGVFRHMLALYGHFSMHSLVKRLHASRPAGASAAPPAAQTDVRRLISVLEHSISNFIKCSVPIVFAACAPASGVVDGVHAAGSPNAAIRDLGVTIVRDVLEDAMRLVEYVLAQFQSEDALVQLRYGTIMPSILPSILIYGIAFAKHRCLMLEIVPDVTKLILKLQQIARTEAGKMASTKLTGVASTPERSVRTGVTEGLERSPPAPVVDGENADVADGFADEAAGAKRDAQQASWWHRVIKLSTTFVATMAAALIHSHPTTTLPTDRLTVNEKVTNAKDAASQSLISEPEADASARLLAYHNVWRFVTNSSGSSSDDQLSFLEAQLARSIEQGRSPQEIVQLCNVHRDKEKATDQVYRMLSQSTQSMFSTSILHLIEETLLMTVVKVCGGALYTPKISAPVFKLISRFIKLILSKRSDLVSDPAAGSWVEVLVLLSNVVTYFCGVLSESYVQVDHFVSLPLPRAGPIENSVCARARGAWRRALMVVVCAGRWRACVRARMSHMAASVVDFVSAAVTSVTSAFTSTSQLAQRMQAIMHELRIAGQDAENYQRGLDMARTLLAELTSSSLRADILSIVAVAMREKSASVNAVVTAHQVQHESTLGGQELSSALRVRPRSSSALCAHLLRTVVPLGPRAAALTQHDLSVLSNTARLLELLTLEQCLDPRSLPMQPMLPLGLLKDLLAQLRDQLPIMVSGGIGADDKAVRRGSVSARERNAAYRRTAQDMLAFLQATATAVSSSAVVCRPVLCAQLVDLHNYLITAYQLQRVEAMKLDALNEEAARLSLEGKDANQLTATHVGVLIGSTAIKQQGKDGNRRRCQDLITKPMEMCRTVEGFVVQGEKLLNNFKGVDFTMCFWMLVSKKSATKQSFITGKVSHSDAWPLVLLRGDGKLEVVFGHASEFEKFSSAASVTFGAWTHVAVIVEQKKIKLFINGVLDASVTTAKGNSKAVLFPLLVGTCPTNVRTKVPLVKEGLDGMLAQYKYYSRALSPIHVKIVHDNGPPETSDISAKLIYQMLASLKCLYRPLLAMQVASSMQDTAGIMHMLFVTDTSRRTRFAALEVLTDILAQDAVTDMSLWSNWSCPSSTRDDPQYVSVLGSSFLDRFVPFRERVVLYFLRLAGACWAPHLLAALNNPLLPPAMPGAQPRTNLSARQSSDSASFPLIHQFLRFAPSLVTTADAHAEYPYSLTTATSGVSVVDKLLIARKEMRIETCHQVLRLLSRLSSVPAWNSAISNVVVSTLDAARTYTETLNTAPLPLRIDTVGAAMLLGGGAAGPYVGSDARNFFGDAMGRILSINKTTNLATLLCWNALYKHQQIVKVRVSDLIVTPRQDLLPLSRFADAAVRGAVLASLETLSAYVPLLLSDYMSTLRPPESILQRTILKGVRPMEVFLFVQLLQALQSGGLFAPLSADLSARPVLLNLLQQATIAALEVQPSAAQHHLGDNRTAYSPPSMASMWLGCANYLFGVPDRVVARQLLGVDEVKALCEFVSRNFRMPAEAILVAPHAKLLKQGRISELVQLMALNETVGSAFAKTELGLLAEAMHNESKSGDYSGYGGQYLMSDWPPTFAVDWPMVSSDISRNEVYCGYMLVLLFHLRKEIITTARAMMAVFRPARPLEDAHWLRDAAMWQALLPPQSADARVQLSDVVDLVNAGSAKIRHTLCQSLFATKRTEVTQMIAVGLKYFSLSLFQINPLLMKPSDNLFETLDLFKRIAQSALHWVDFADTQPAGEEVSIQLLKLLMPTLSFIDNSAVALQLTQLCMHLVRKLTVKAFEGYQPSKELLEIAKSNNFTLLRARAQEQVLKFKTHNMGSISPLAYNLTQLVSGMELLQRQGAARASAAATLTATAADHVFNTPPGSAVKPSATAGSATKAAQSMLTARIEAVETAAPKISTVRTTSVDCDLTPCAESVCKLMAEGHTAGGADGDSAAATVSKVENVVVEVAIGAGGIGSDCFYETVYCGASQRLVQSNLVPNCVYSMRCRAYVGSAPLAWSAAVEFRTQKGVLFTFDAMKCGPDIRIGEDGLTASYGNDDTWSTVLGNRAFSSGVTTWNIRINSSSTAYIFVGAATSAADLSSFLGGCGCGWGFIGEQALYHNREKVKVYGESFSSGDIVGVELDLNQGTISFLRNGKPLGVAFDKVFGELYPACAFYNVGQELEILTEGCSTTCTFESIPISPSRLNMDDISLLNELVLSLYRKHPLSHRLQVLVAEHCNQWCLAGHVRRRAVSGRDVFLATESALLKKFSLSVGERVRTPFGVAEVAGTAFNKVWFVMNAAGEVWYFNVQQILDGRGKKLFLRCTYDDLATNAPSEVTGAAEENEGLHQVTYDAASIQDLLDPAKWSEEMDCLLQNFLAAQADAVGAESQWGVTSQQVTDNFRVLQQQFSRLMVDSHELSHRWGITGPKRKAVLARIGLLRLLNQMLDMYLPFLVADSASKAFVQNQPTVTDDFAPQVISLPPEEQGSEANKVSAASNGTPHWVPPASECTTWPLIALSWDTPQCASSVSSRELLIGPIHAIRRLIFYPMKKNYFWEVLRRSATRPAKTDDDYDYPDDLPHVKINRLKSFRAREASELLLIPGEDLMLSSMFCQLWRELRQHNDEKLRISYTHPMDDGQSRTFKIKFEGEGVDDYGGPYREIFQQICEELQSVDPSARSTASGRPSSWLGTEDKQTGDGGFATASSAVSAAAQAAQTKPSGAKTEEARSPVPTRCFLPLLMPTPNWTADSDCSERYRYMFHPGAESPLKMDLFHFLGQLVGIAVRSKITLDLALPSYIWKYVVCERLTEQDIASFDAPAYAALQRLGAVHAQLTAVQAQQARGEAVDASAHAMLQYNALELVSDLTWSYTRSDGVEIELIEGKGQQPVELSDLGHYLVLYAEARLCEGRNAIGMFRRGLVSILPETALSLLNWEELQAAVCGPRTIDVQRLKENTEYDDDISPEDEHIVFFWEVLHSFSEAEKSAFLRFVWARPTLPPKGVEFTQKMRVLSAVGEDAHLKPDQYLPKAHTCFFSINLPKYTSKQLMSEKLLYAIFNCTEMDADFRTTDTEVAGWGAASSVPADWQAQASTEV